MEYGFGSNKVQRPRYGVRIWFEWSRYSLTKRVHIFCMEYIFHHISFHGVHIVYMESNGCTVVTEFRSLMGGGGRRGGVQISDEAFQYTYSSEIRLKILKGFKD